MNPVLLYGVPQGCSFGSIVALEWLGEPYRLCRIAMPDAMQGDLYARFNPVRETPVLVQPDGTTLAESAAILQHIAARGIAKGLGFPQGTPEHDRLNRMLSFLTTTFFASFSPLWRAYEMAANPPVQDVLRAVGREDVAKAHANLEAILGEGPWLLGAGRTVADAYLAGIARWAVYHQAADQAAYPRLHRLLRALDADPAVRFAHAVEAGEPARGSGACRGHVALEELAPRLAA